MYIKDFDKWNEIKKQISSQNSEVHIRAGEVRWVALGVNIGSEMDGKGMSFTRPALITYVIGARLALVIPMSTKLKDVIGYQSFDFQGKAVSLCLHQMRTISQNRIFARKGRISDQRLALFRSEVSKFFSL